MNADTRSDALSIFDQISTGYKIIKTIYCQYERYKFDTFLTALYDATHNPQHSKPIRYQDVEKYLQNSTNITFIAEIIAASLHSQSVRCSAILGTYAGGIISRQGRIEYKDRIVVSALKAMYDDDLSNFIKLYEFISNHPELHEPSFYEELRIRDIVDKIESLGIRGFEMELTVEKLKSVQAIGYEAGGFGCVGNAWGVFLFNENTDYLYNIVKKSPFKHQLLDEKHNWDARMFINKSHYLKLVVVLASHIPQILHQM